MSNQLITTIPVTMHSFIVVAACVLAVICLVNADPLPQKQHLNVKYSFISNLCGKWPIVLIPIISLVKLLHMSYKNPEQHLALSL